MKTFVFPGQGSQARGMGASLFDEFKDLVDRASGILGYSVTELCIDDPRGELGRTEFTQPALFVVNALSYLKRVRETGKKPDYLVGHSLGELNALLAAECFDFEAGLRIVQRRGELMGQVANGGMAAIINATPEELETALRQNGLENIDLANYNTPTQIVISGPIEELKRAEALFTDGRVMYYPLRTSGPFHSRHMSAAKAQFRAYLRSCTFRELKIPVIANVSAKPYREGEVLENLAEQITSPVRWTESIRYLMGLSLNGADAMQFEEIGHGNVLMKLIDGIRRHPRAGKGDAAAKSPSEGGELPAGDPAPIDSGNDRSSAMSVPSAPARHRGNLDAQGKVIAWNARYPIGTKVRMRARDDGELETRTEAVVLFGHRAAVYMKGFNGYFDLDEIEPIAAVPLAA